MTKDSKENGESRTTVKSKPKKLTKKQKDFADEYVRTGNGRQSALKAYDVKNVSTAGSIASETLTIPNVREYIEQQAAGAAQRVAALSKESKNEVIRLSANKDILDRAGYKAVEKSQQVIATVNIDVSNEKAQKLIESFEDKLKGEMLE